MTERKSIAQRDKELMDLQAQIEDKEAQLKQDYQRLVRDVKQNPYLEVALEEYKAYFAKEKAEKIKKIKALTVLLEHIEANQGDQADAFAIKGEIKRIKKIYHYYK
jgi:hypothetical protein